MSNKSKAIELKSHVSWNVKEEDAEQNPLIKVNKSKFTLIYGF